MYEKRKKKDDSSFWTTVPGILTGLAAVLTAFATLSVALHQSSGGGSADSASAGHPVFVSAAEPQPAPTVPPLAGTWYGIPINKLLMVVHIEGPNAHLKATFNTPCQTVTDFPVNTINLQGTVLTFKVAIPGTAPLNFNGEVSEHEISGTEWQDGIQSSPVTLTRQVLSCPH